MTTITTDDTQTTLHIFCHPLAPLDTLLQIEDAIERCYERVTDRLDAGLMNDELNQVRYDQMSQQLKEWVSKREAAITLLRGTTTSLLGTSELQDEASA